MRVVKRTDFRNGAAWCPLCDVTEVQFRNGDRHYGKGLLVVPRAIGRRFRRLGLREALHQTRHVENE